MKCFVGLDVSSTKLDVCNMTNNTELGVLFYDSLANDLSSTSEIKKQILELNEQYVFNRIVIGMESTSLYSFHPAMFFNDDSDLKKRNISPFSTSQEQDSSSWSNSSRPNNTSSKISITSAIHSQ